MHLRAKLIQNRGSGILPYNEAYGNGYGDLARTHDGLVYNLVNVTEYYNRLVVGVKYVGLQERKRLEIW